MLSGTVSRNNSTNRKLGMDTALSPPKDKATYAVSTEQKHVEIQRLILVGKLSQSQEKSLSNSMTMHMTDMNIRNLSAIVYRPTKVYIL